MIVIGRIQNHLLAIHNPITLKSENNTTKIALFPNPVTFQTTDMPRTEVPLALFPLGSGAVDRQCPVAHGPCDCVIVCMLVGSIPQALSLWNLDRGPTFSIRRLDNYFNYSDGTSPEHL